MRNKKGFHFRKMMRHCGVDILRDQGMILEQDLPHHTITAYEHSVGVAYMSFRLVEWFRMDVDEASLMRGALLHDYYLYNCHEREKYPNHLVEHPRIACDQASEVYDLNELEQEIILHHMFPITPQPPKHKESVLVCIADKICAAYELIMRMPVQKGRSAQMLLA